LPGTLGKESHNLGTRKQIRVPHPRVKREYLGVVLAESGGVHVIEDDDITQNLPDPFSRTGMQRKMLDTDSDVKEPIRGMSV
jgi:hypothetical protein